MVERQPAAPVDDAGRRLNEIMEMVDDNTPSGLGNFLRMPVHLQQIILSQADITTAARFGEDFKRRYPELAGRSTPRPEFVGLRDGHRYAQQSRK